ncbi:MAG: amino acid ABC transporter ATP-binding protein [Proteobacteria bacterium]|nr:amino acid ABC transporter ATP-binding protein [Pseudomonadota bacterium]
MVSVVGLNKWYGSHQVLARVNLAVRAGERVVVCGPSGSGKSTLARCLNGLESYDHGDVTVNGVRISPRTRHADLVQANIGMVFQQFNLFPHLSVLDNCVLAQTWVRKRPKAQARAVALEFLEKVRLADKANRYPSTLSGGQQQRVAIARALCLDPSVMLFDEATSALDPEMVQEVLETMIQLARDGMTMVCITHEMGFARAVADQVVFMEAGRIVQAAPPEVFFGDDADPRIRRFLKQSL